MKLLSVIQALDGITIIVGLICAMQVTTDKAEIISIKKLLFIISIFYH